jgi:hypothetical protein
MKRVLVIGEYHPELKAALDEAVKNGLIKSYINFTTYTQQADEVFNKTGLPQAVYHNQEEFILSFTKRDDIMHDWIIMKGHIHSADFLRLAMKLNKAVATRYVLLTNKTLSHCAILERGNIRFILTDAAFNLALSKDNTRSIRDNAVECYCELINDATGLAALEGGPKTVYVLAENNTNIPGHEFKDILQQYWNYPHKPIEVLQLDAALDLDIAKLKNPKITGKDLADILIVPDINVGNAIWKSLTVFGDFTVAGIVWGMYIPCLLNSRGDKKASYYKSLEYGVKILPYVD